MSSLASSPSANKTSGNTEVGKRKRASTATVSKKLKAKVAEDNAKLVTSLIQSLPRSNLEALLYSAVQSSISISLEMIKDANPCESKVKTLIMKSKGEKFDIISGPSRMNTGAFDCIDDSIMGGILSGLSFTERVQAVTSVCKAWIEFKDSMPFLWTSLSWKMFNPDGRRKRHRAMDITEAIRFIPNLQDLTEMRLVSTKEDGAQGNAIMKLLLAKKVAPRLRRVELQGAKINITAINSLAKICGEDLKEFACMSMSMSSKISLEPIFRKASGITHLKMPADIETTLSRVVNTLSLGRNGQPTLLQSIDMSGTEWSYFDHTAFVNLSRLCPELETLKVGRLGIPGIPFPVSSGNERQSRAFPTHLFNTPLEPFRRLKTFSTNSTVCNYHYVYHSSEQIQQILHWLLGSMPVLEDFQFGIGACSQDSFSAKDLKNYRRPPYPSLGKGLQELPRSIRRITLFDFDVDEGTLEPLLDYPVIEYVAMLNCGPMLNSMQRLSMKHEQYHFEGQSPTASIIQRNPFLHIDEKEEYIAIRLYRDASCLPAPLDKNDLGRRGHLIYTFSEQNLATWWCHSTPFRDVRDVPV